MIVVENYQKEQDIKDQLILSDNSQCGKRAIGHSITDIVEKIKNNYTDPPLDNTFNLQRHMVRKAAADIEEYVMEIKSENDVSKGFISYTKKIRFF